MQLSPTTDWVHWQRTLYLAKIAIARASERYRYLSIHRIHHGIELLAQDFSLSELGLLLFDGIAGRVARIGEDVGAMGDLEGPGADHG
jgi:hypothetical protein